MKVEGKEEGQTSYRTIIVGPTNGSYKKVDKKYVGVFVYVLHMSPDGLGPNIQEGKNFITQICQSL